MTDYIPAVTAAAARAAQLDVDYDERFVNAKRVYADDAVRGTIYFRHHGERALAVGRENIDWTGGHWQHQEWPAQLNRFFFWAPLLVAWRETGDEQYAQAARDYIADWLAQRPLAADGSWSLYAGDNTLNLSIRVHMWMTSLPDFCASEAFDEALVGRIVASAAGQLNFLMDHLATHMNWRIAHADSLLLNGMRLDFLDASAAWRDLGVRVINDAFQRQVTADGVHAERNPGYHAWMTRIFTRYLSLADKAPQLGLRIDRDRVVAMYDYWVATRRPNGELCGLHDCAGKHSGSRPADWDAPRRNFYASQNLPAAMPDPVQIFPIAGQAFLRSDWSEQAEYWTFDASRWGGGHCHVSRNAVQLHAHGRSLLVDPGTLTYESTDPMAYHGRATRAHNTLTINGLNQYETNPEMTTDRAGDIVLVQSLYNGGYWPGRLNWSWPDGKGRGIAGSHHRALLWVPGRYGIVIDQFEHDPKESGLRIESNWQTGSGCTVQLSGLERAEVRAGDEAGVLMLFALAGDDVTLTSHSGEMEPTIRGWIPGELSYEAAPQISLQCSQSTDWGQSLVTVIAPAAGGELPDLRIVEAINPDVTGYGKLVLAWGDGSRDTLHWTGRFFKSLDRCDDLQTDASLLWQATSAAGEHVRGFALDATYVRGHVDGSRDWAGALAY